MGSGDGRIGIGLKSRTLEIWHQRQLSLGFCAFCRNRYRAAWSSLHSTASHCSTCGALAAFLRSFHVRWRALTSRDLRVLVVRGGPVKTANGVPLVTGWRGSGQTTKRGRFN